MDGQERVGGVTRGSTLRKLETYEARTARRTMSLPELLLWQRLKGSPQGVAFRKQHVIGPYRADFYCAAAKLVIEVDGLAHDMGDRPGRDEQRTAWLEQRGYRVLRILASEVLRNPDEVATSLIAYAQSSPFTGRGTGEAGGGGHPPDQDRTDRSTGHPPPPSLRDGPPPRQRGGV